MMYADLVDMVDFVQALYEIGIKCLSNETESVKRCISDWFKNVDSDSAARFWQTLMNFETKGVLSPDVEEVLEWSHRQLPH